MRELGPIVFGLALLAVGFLFFAVAEPQILHDLGIVK